MVSHQPACTAQRLAQLPGQSLSPKHSRIDKLRWVPYLFPSHPVDFSPKQLSFQVHWLELLHDCVLISVNFNSLHFLLHKKLASKHHKKICLKNLDLPWCPWRLGPFPWTWNRQLWTSWRCRPCCLWRSRFLRFGHAHRRCFLASPSSKNMRRRYPSPKLFQSLDFRRRHLHNCAGHQHLSRQDTCLPCVWQTYLLTSMKIKGFPVYHTAAEIISKQWWRQEHLCRHEGMPWCRSTCGSEKKKQQLA